MSANTRVEDIPQATSYNAILFESTTKDIFVIDIPMSIEQAQGAKSTANRRQLHSCPPPREPYPNSEPKTKLARDRLMKEANPEQVLRNESYARLVDDAFASLANGRYNVNFCLPRAAIAPERLGKRRRQEIDQTHSDLRVAEDEDELPKLLANFQDLLTQCPRTDNLVASPLIVNHLDRTRTLTMDLSGSKLSFSIPPRSAALNANIKSTPESLTALATFNGGRFAAILLDPPWQNRSARRGGSYGSHKDYDGSKLLPELGILLESLRLQDHLQQDGYICVWITNKAATRDITQQLFDSCGVELIEEWLWVKITANGEAVCPVRGLQRQPWEVLLVARQPHGGKESSCAPQSSDSSGDNGIKTRVIFAVPDIHSRKPCLKELFKRLLFSGHNYSSLDDNTVDTVSAPVGGDLGTSATTTEANVLELFGRNMVASWMTWGDEALKYQADTWAVTQAEEIVERLPALSRLSPTYT